MHPSATWLWRSALVDERPDASKAEQAFFAHHLNVMPERATVLVARIASDMPGYTVHDETHLDALWETASLVASRDLALKPPEALVFGGAVLLHDAAMTLAAYPGGLPELKKTTAWADAAALHGVTPSDKKGSPPTSPEVEAQIKTEVLRRLHAEKAAELATSGWQVRDNDDERMYLIDDPELRRFYGPSIGSVAHSHWWPIARVERDLSKILGAMPPHTRHQVDLLKLAALLRVFDALHLDRRRAPRFVRALEQPQGFSALHWTAQERLAFPRIEDDAVVFTSGEPFEAKDADAWWLAYDVFVLADQELRDADLLLRSGGRSGLAARRVKGVTDPREMARYVPVAGWRPVETRVRVSDVPKIIQTLGGEKLYGYNATAPLRELLQNAMDAIQARRRLQARASDWGLITVELAERDDDIWLSVEDTGVGMSEAVLVGPLVDFGSSLWRSPQIAEEYPGLAAKGMDAVGRFGIGFFSVFMLGDDVRVTTRRYDRAENESLVLEFRHGLSSRPILSPAEPGTVPLDGGTRVDVKLRVHPRSERGIRLLSKESKEDWSVYFLFKDPSEFPSLADLVAWLAPTADVSIDAIEFGQRMRAVSAGDWLTISGAKLADRVSPSGTKDQTRKTAETFLRPLVTTDGQVVGRAALYPSPYMWAERGALVFGGLRVSGVRHFLGVVPGDVATAARNTGDVLLEVEALSKWANEQVRLIESSDLSAEHKTICAEIALESGATVLGLPVAKWGGVWLSSDELRSRFTHEDEVPIYLGDVVHGANDPVPRYVFEREFEPIDDILFISLLEPFHSTSHLKNHVLAILRQVWGGYEEHDDHDRVVGRANGEEITRSVEVLWRPKVGSLAARGS